MKRLVEINGIPEMFFRTARPLSSRESDWDCSSKRERSSRPECKIRGLVRKEHAGPHQQAAARVKGSGYFGGRSGMDFFQRGFLRRFDFGVGFFSQLTSRPKSPGSPPIPRVRC